VLTGENDTLSGASQGSLRAALDDGTAFLRTLQNILDLWRLKQGELPVEIQDVNFRETVGEAIFSVQDAIGDKPLAIEQRIDARFPKIRTDLTKISQILFLLLDNAVKFTPRGRIEIAARVTEGRLHCEIRDTGIGICPDDRQYIFDEFYQLAEPSARRYHGAGLGLTLVRDLLLLLGGEISVASEVGRGTTFRVYLPATVGVPPEREDAVHENDAGGGERILVVEDEPGVRAIVREVLEDQGYVVEEAAEPLAALELFEEDRAFDLLVSDVVMPGMNGVQLAGRLLERRPGLRVLLMSGYPSHGGVDLASLEAAFLQKPFGTDALVRKVRGVLDQRSAQAPAEPLEVAGSA
jgi:CheY-like chemotaxis protein